MPDPRVEKILSQLEPYINGASEKVAAFYKMHKWRASIVEGVEIELTPKMCAEIYKGIVTDMINTQRTGGIKYGLSVSMVAKGKLPDGTTQLSFRLGIVF